MRQTSILPGLMRGVAMFQAETEAGSGEPGPVEAEAEIKRTKIADRDWIDAKGEAVAEENAVAARYTFLADGKSATFTPKTDDAATRMLAIFGAQTLMGNLTNTWKVEKGERADSPVDVIAERFQLLADGKWIDRSAAGVGAKVDKDALAGAFIDVALADGKVTDATKDATYAKVRARLEEDAGYLRAVRSVPAISAAYSARVGRVTKTLEDVFAGL